MSFIVFSPKEKKIIADTYVLECTNLSGGIVKASNRTENKIKITEDNYFAYCFHCLQQEEFLPFIFNYLIRFETGALGKEDTIEFPSGFSGALGVASKRHFYRIEPGLKHPIQIRDQIWVNAEEDVPEVFRVLELDAEDIWNAAIKEMLYVVNGEKQVVSTTKLSLIKKPAKKKEEK